jgi:YHS domain-containing protein
MKSKGLKAATALVLIAIITSCASKKSSGDEAVMDIVCGMKVNKSESFDSKYQGRKYYFDSYDCKKSFDTNPQIFVLKSCTPNENIIDLVCGTKVDLSTSYDLKYSGKVYHFHSYECKTTFKMNPEKFLKNRCEPKDSIK